MIRFKFLSGVVIMGLLLGLLPADIRAEAMDDQLAKVTQQVKAQVQIDSRYTTFQGESRSHGLEQYWELNWSNDNNDQLNITADQKGKILSYYRYDDEGQGGRYDGYFVPVFPQLDRKQAQGIAEAFLRQVLAAPVETCRLDSQGHTELRKDGMHYFDGTIYLNGLVSPITVNISVDSGKQAVMSFQRSDAWRQFVGSIPGPKPAVSKEQAAKSLNGTLALKLEYVTDPDNHDKAVLRYLPVSQGNYLVDAQTGKLIDIAELYKELEQGEMEAAFDQAAVGAANGASRKSMLTEVELQGIDKLRDVLTSDVLDGRLRAMPELGLKDFTLAESRYYYDRNKDSYTCRLTYALQTKQDAERKITQKYVVVDSKTGALQSLSTSYPYNENQISPSLTKAEAQKKAESFLSRYFKENYDKTRLYAPDSSTNKADSRALNNHAERSISYQYAQIEKGYYFPENMYTVSVDAVTGNIDNFSGNFRKTEFQSPTGIISKSQALQAYFGAYEVTLGYESLPKKIDLSQPQWRPLIEQGYTYLQELRLAYTLKAKQVPWAIDAKTGKPLYNQASQSGPIVYEDANLINAKAKTLAQYGIGFAGSKFKPEESLTQVDMLTLLLSADNYHLDPQAQTEDYDYLYNRAYQLGILTKAQRDPARKISRMEYVKAIINMSGYGKAANLQGIYTSKYEDFAAIAAADQGYAAIAQGLGLVKSQTFAAKGILTRQEAADILHDFMLNAQ